MPNNRELKLDTEETRTVGLIGLGLLGTAIAHRLIRAGYTVWGHDISPQAMSSFSLRGGQAIVKTEDVPVAANPVVLALPGSDVVHDVIVRIIPRLNPGTILIDTTTGDPNRTRKTAELVADAGIMLVDPAVMGASNTVRDGNAQLLVGGSPLSVKECRHVLEAISMRIHHVGRIGAGQEMKLITTLVQGLNEAALAEGLHLASKISADSYAVLEILKSGSAYSKVMDSKGLRMIDQEFSPQTRLNQQLEDVQLLLQKANEVETTLPLSETHESLLRTAEANGHGQLDSSAIIRAWDRPAPEAALCPEKNESNDD